MTEADILIRSQQILDEVCHHIEHSKWKDMYLYSLKSLADELHAPCVLAVAGKVKAGKSFLINSLLGVDLAMTGNTETTATINVFKKGRPLSPEKPVLCQWTNGKKEWKEISFLERLQGSDEETLRITAEIDRLIFYVEDNPMLEEVTLVDTPGIGADVGDDGDAHQIQTDAYFKLRKKHEDNTVSLSNTADAVIYLFNTVPTETDKSFLDSLYDGGHGLTSQNGIGVLSKVDKNIEQLKNVDKFAKEFEKELFSILPTSAALTKVIPDINKACELKKTLKEWFPNEKTFLMAISSEKAFLHPKLPQCSISPTLREQLVSKYLRKDIPWSLFVLLSKELYYTDNIEESLTKLSRIAGIEPLRELIYNHFFRRSRLLRCNKILNELRRVINDILYDSKLLKAEQYGKNRLNIIRACETLSEPYRTTLINIVNEYVETEEVVQKIKASFQLKKNEVDDLLLQLRDINNSYMAYQKLLASKHDFSKEEISELSTLFSGQRVIFDYRDRQKYWSRVTNSSPSNSIRQQIAKIAKTKYSLLIQNEL